MDDKEMKDFSKKKVILEESKEIPLEAVKFEREWTFWENYESKISSKTQNKDIEYNCKDIFTFNTIIAFWQFWNIYPGNDPANIFYDGDRLIYYFPDESRIIAVNLFLKDIKPEWEDENNKGGKIFSMEYEVKDDIKLFLKQVKITWEKMILQLIGENLEDREYINGIRFTDKTKVGRKSLFRLELWLNKNLPKEHIDLLKKKYGERFGCPGIVVKDIPS